MGKTKKGLAVKKPVVERVSGDPMGVKLPLADQIESLKLTEAKDRQKLRKRQAEEDFVDDKLSARILNEARRQQIELQNEFDVNDHDANNNNNNTVHLEPNRKYARFSKAQPTRFSANKTHDVDDSETSDSDSEHLNDHDYSNEEIVVNEEDQRAFDLFMSDKPTTRRTIADIIYEKLAEKKTEIQTQLTENESRAMEMQIDDRIVNMYEQIREVLSKYRSGRLPKAFKILPSLANWEHILYITEPDNWSAASVYQATRIFASNLNAKMAQRFFNLVLLPRIRDDINEYKRLNFHLYMALRKSLFKPAAFFKGILLPLCDSRTCTLREAVIVGSVLAKNSIPMLHSAAALLKLAEMEYTGANSIFIRILLEKKYALPFRVIDAVVHHFAGFQRDTRELPVLWHQALLTFCQRYKEDISAEQKEALLELIKAHTHREITNEIRRELMNSKCRDIEDANSQFSMDYNFDEK